MRKKIVILAGMLLSAFGIFVSNISPIVHAAEDTQEKVALSVSANLPENQISPDSGYFDLKVQPGNKQELSVTLKNLSDKKITARIDVTAATTNKTGSIDYSKEFDADSKDKSLLYPMTDILVPEDQTVEIAANSEVETKLKLAVPNEKFDGIVLGAIRIFQEDQTESEKNDDTGVTIKNKFAYNIGVRLNETDNVVEPKLNLLGIEASQEAGRNTIFAHLQNESPMIIENVSYEAAIYKEKDSTILHENKVNNYRIAPNSNYEFPIDWGNERFTAGNYTLKMKVTSKDTGDIWEFDEPFTITRAEAQDLNSSAVDLEDDYTQWIVVGAIVFGLLLLIVVIVIVVYRKKKKEKRRKAKRKRLEKNRQKVAQQKSRKTANNQRKR